MKLTPIVKKDIKEIVKSLKKETRDFEGKIRHK